MEKFDVSASYMRRGFKRNGSLCGWVAEDGSFVGDRTILRLLERENGEQILKEIEAAHHAREATK